MASLFKELELLDRPYIPMSIQIGGRKIDIEIRLPSAQEQDAIDAFYMDFYAKTIAEKLEIKPGRKTSERDSLRLIYESRPKADLIEQLLPTRQADIEVRAYELAGLDREEQLREIYKLAQTDPEKAQAHARWIDDTLADTRINARSEVASIYEKKTVEELARIMSDVNINLKATQLAGQAREADVIYYSSYGVGGNERLFESPEEVLEELRPEKISEITLAMRKALSEHEDLPFASPDDKEPNGQPSSQSGSVEATKAGGKRTKTTPESSKQSSTPVS